MEPKTELTRQPQVASTDLLVAIENQLGIERYIAEQMQIGAGKTVDQSLSDFQRGRVKGMEHAKSIIERMTSN